MDISDAVLNSSRDLEVQLSTNIGEDQLLFDRSEKGQAIQKSLYEIVGKAAQAAIGVACAMGTRVHPCNLVKVGVDGMQVETVIEALNEVVLTLNRTEQFCHTQVMSVLFAQDIKAWNERKKEDEVRKQLVTLREFHKSDPDDPNAFDLCEYAVGTLRNKEGRFIFNKREEVSLDSLIEQEILSDDATSTMVALNELFPHSTYFKEIAAGERTNKDVIQAMVDATAKAGADSIMLDTRIQSKVARISLVDTSSEGLIDINRFDYGRKNPKLARTGILSLEEIKFFVDYCHYKGIEANVAGSVQSYQAQQLWVKIPEVDQVSTRGASSALRLDPYRKGEETMDSRQDRVIKRSLVRGLAAPEHGGVLNIFQPIWEKELKGADEFKQLIKMLREERKKQSLPELECYVVDKYGNPTKIE